MPLCGCDRVARSVAEPCENFQRSQMASSLFGVRGKWLGKLLRRRRETNDRARQKRVVRERRDPGRA